MIPMLPHYDLWLVTCGMFHVVDKLQITSGNITLLVTCESLRRRCQKLSGLRNWLSASDHIILDRDKFKMPNYLYKQTKNVSNLL